VESTGVFTTTAKAEAHFKVIFHPFHGGANICILYELNQDAAEEMAALFCYILTWMFVFPGWSQEGGHFSTLC
jgi:hypothetical protein